MKYGVNGTEVLKDRECLWYVGGDSTIRPLSQNFIKPASRVHCSVAFGELVIKFPESQIKDNIDTLMLVLIDILRDVPFLDFDECLSWQGMFPARLPLAMSILYLIL